MDAPQQPPKRPLMRSRGPPPGLFGRALSGLRRDASGAPKREAKHLDWDAPEEGETMRQRAATPPTTSAPAPLPLMRETPLPLMRETTQETVVTDSTPSSSPAPLLPTPSSRLPSSRLLSSRLLSSRLLPRGRTTQRQLRLSKRPVSARLHALRCQQIPPALNKREILEKHFRHFGKVRRIYCRPQRNSAVIHFEDHASAAKAKRKGQMLLKNKLMLLWQRKKQSPGGREPGESPERSSSSSRWIQRPSPRAPAISSSVSFSSPVKKSSMPRSLQFEEPARESTSDQSPQPEMWTRPWTGLRTSCGLLLLHLIGQTAETAEEKYRLLEQRDKILRQGRQKRTHFLIGTCPDMCPEKERYMRETRKQLSVYEVLPNTEMVRCSSPYSLTCGPRRAVKEYSRSSADQEEPLPHELRPLPVLTQTMDYIVTQILDQGEDNYRDWYDFVWNRTRGIRKDIIQQHLCCPDTVALIEKCTRFHVHCAHQLCEEPMSSFDSKINNENMTKCLQSLKEMYEDLSTRGVFCPREAEFRQYNVLLKLNDGDILREVQQFRDEIRNSPEVKFAVQAFSAVSSNNFVRFFKLVRSTSYLCSCLLHRYFNQVRSRALSILNMAHTVGPRSTAFPLDDIVRLLMFRDGDEASAFIQQYGLNVSDGVVELSRTNFQDPDLPVSSHRSEVILSKRRVLIGEVVNGGPSNPPQHNPVCSFDALDKFRDVPEAMVYRASTSVSVSVSRPAAPEPELSVRPSVFGAVLVQPAPAPSGSEETGESAPFVPAPERQFQPISQPSPPPPAAPPPALPAPVAPPPAPVKAPTPPPPKPVYSNEEIESELNRVVEEVIDAAVKEIAEAAACFTSAALEVSSEQVESLVAEVTENLLTEISTNEVRLEQERIAEEKRQQEEASFSLCSELVYEVLDETIKETAASEIQEAVDEKAARVSRCTDDVCSALLDETLNTDIALLVEQILDVELQRIHKYIKRWRDVVFLRRQLKRQMRAFPAAPCFVDPRFRLKALAPSAPEHTSIQQLSKGLVNLGHSGDMSVSSSRLLKIRDEVIHKMRVQYFYQLLIEETSWAPLNLPALVMEHFPNPPPKVFCKTLVLLPSEHETGDSVADRILCDWLEVKLGAEPDDCSHDDGTLQTLCVSNSIQETELQTHTVHISVKASCGPLSEDGLCKAEESCELQGTTALLMLLPASALLDQQKDEDVPLLSALLQLKQLQQACTWHCALPLVILVPGQERGPGHTDRLAQALKLSKLVEDGLISEYIFLFLPENTSDLQGSKQLTAALRWLVSRSPPVLPLSCQTLVQLVESALTRDFSCRVYSHRQERAAAALTPQRPLPVIRLYNALLDHLALAVSSQDLCKLSWPPVEFSVPEMREFVPPVGWNCPEHLKWIREAVMSLKLPEWDDDAPTDSWSEVCSSIFSFAAQIPVSRRARPLLVSRLENLLERVRAGVGIKRTPGAKMSWSSWAQREDEICSAVERIPWDDVLVVCIDHKLKDWTLPGPPVCEEAVIEDGEILVYFQTEALSSFTAPDEWTEAVKQTHREKHEQQERVCGESRAPRPSVSLQKRLFFNLREPEQPRETNLDFSHTATPEEALAHRVLQQLEEEKQETNRLRRQVFRRIASVELLQGSFPLLNEAKNYSVFRLVSTVCVLEPEVGSEFPRTPRPSLSWRMKELERQILASREEEKATKLHLNELLHIVQD
ncbi:hypothetical protein WMY93_031417 [Mugilogobius chulae]|uniref:Germinal-center associated nuclear protein n=1 Tax=Mugilogobius chulae TaxID=88201 RepID=A0AAW0MGD6_9GOBI